MQKRFYVCFDDFERRVLANCLNDMRTRLLAEKKDSEPVDELLLKVIDAPKKRVKIVYKED
jgi:hypothetical protein